MYGQIVNIIGFASHLVFDMTTQFCHCSAKAAIDNMPMNRYGHLHFITKIYLQKQAVGLIYPIGHTLPIPDVEQGARF